MQDVKPVGEGISEIRIGYGPGYRVHYIQRSPVLVVLLCGDDDKGSRRQQRDNNPRVERLHDVCLDIEEIPGA